MQLNLYEKPPLYLKARIVTWVVALFGTIFISTGTALQPNFYTDGFGHFADGLQLAPLVWSLLWTSVSIGLYLASKPYHPGIDVAFDLIAILLACGTVWLIIDWTATIGDYYQNCYDDDCTRAQARIVKASEVIGIIAILISMYEDIIDL